ncbi:MAG: hypothetical protein HFH12_14315 [Dorea sp.]|nr:hypothetical protein [Dorea sp.]
MDFVQYKCPCCGAALNFSGAEQKLACKSCGNTYDVSVLREVTKSENAPGEQKLEWEERRETAAAKRADDGRYLCPSCGGEIEADENTASTKCPYCENVVVIRQTVTGRFEPDAVIPFQIEADRARQMLEDFCKGKRLLPRNFKDKSYLKNLKGYYVPYWLFDCDVYADMSFQATRTRMWSDSNYDYVETSHYLVNRSGNMRFYHVPVDGSIQMSDETTESIEPFDYRGLTEFRPAYLAGYETDKYDVGADTAKNRANERIYNSAEQEMAGTVIGYDTVRASKRSLRSSNGHISYVLLPVWLFETAYNGKNYQFAINGQTGKMVGELPVDKGAFWRYLFGFTGIGTAVLSLLILLAGGAL